jgi:spermidine/putrescine transport system substrate-binding protein
MASSGLIRVRSFAPVRRRRFLQGAAAVGGLAMGGPFLSGSARADTSIVFLGWQGYDEGLTTEDFLAKNEITLETTYIGNNDEIVSKLQAGGIGSIDIVTPYMGYIPLMAAAGLIDPIDEALVPNLAVCEPVFRDDSNVIIDGVRYSVPFTWGSAPMMYDPVATGGVPASWEDLWKPEYKGKVGMMDDPVGNMMLAALLSTDAEVPTLLTMDQLKQAEDYLIRLKREQVRVIAVSWGDLADALARGDVVITFSGWETIKKFCADKGKAIDYTYPSEGTFAWLDSYCIAKDAPNREVDHALCNKVIDVPAQLKIGDDFLQGIVNKDAIAQLGPSKDIYPYTDLASFSQKARMFGFPPLEPDGEHATWQDFQEAYQRFKTA